jgi:hypothetical protein
MIFDTGMLYDFEEVCTGLEERKESVQAIAFIRHDRLPDPFPKFTVKDACEALAVEKEHPVMRVWFSDAEAIAHGAQQVFEVNEVMLLLQGGRPDIAKDQRVYFLCEPMARVWQWLPVQLRGEGTKAVKEIKIVRPGQVKKAVEEAKSARHFGYEFVDPNE